MSVDRLSEVASLKHRNKTFLLGTMSETNSRPDAPLLLYRLLPFASAALKNRSLATSPPNSNHNRSIH